MVEGYLAGAVADDPFVGLALPDGWDGAEGWRARAAAVVAEQVRPAYERVAAALAELAERGRGDDRPGLVHVPGGDEL
ncbi:MAG TPA: DUF885 domain-containing protein, partial [Acidimicrobiaceae bacterium]|nr:DUF885 domain-containing protein [Acidimicrobiaceae bacterium]